jgi:hypothetical protein
MLAMSLSQIGRFEFPFEHGDQLLLQQGDLTLCCGALDLALLHSLD